MPQLLPLRLLETVGLGVPSSAPKPSDGTASGRLGSVAATSGGVPALTAPRSTVADHDDQNIDERLIDIGSPFDIEPHLERTVPISIIAPRRIGESDLVVSPLSLAVGGFDRTADGEKCLAILDRFTGLGGDFIDTGNSSAGGGNEALVGAWMRERGNRDELVVATMVGRHHESPHLGPTGIVRAVEASLERLQTDRIDLLYLYDNDPKMPMGDSLATVDWLIEAGKVRYLAASHFSADRLIEARVLASAGLPKFVAVHAQYNLMHRTEFESALRIVAAAQGLAVMPYDALAGDFLTGTYRSKSDLNADARSVRASAYVNRKGMRTLAMLDRIAVEHGVAPTSVAIAWLLAKRTIIAPVASARRPEQVDGLMAAAGIRLTRTQMRELDRVSA